MSKRDFLSLLDLAPQELEHIIRRAHELKQQHQHGIVHQPLIGRSAALILQLNSTRTRVAFDAGMAQLGGNTVVLGTTDTQLGRGEPLQDTARVLSEMVHAIIIRTLSHEDLETFARFASVPVINAMTSRFHPCQLLADIQTFEELRGSIQGRRVAFIGDGYNMCNSYINAAQQWQFELRVATPSGYEPEDSLVNSTDLVQITQSPEEAVENADLVVTDVWSSMGHESQTKERLALFSAYQVNENLLNKASEDVLFMHCLPAHRGEEVSTTLLDDPRSVVWQEAGNRLHTQKALLEYLLIDKLTDNL